MRFSARSKVSILLSLVTIITLVGAFAVTIVSHGTTTHAASFASPSQAVKFNNFKVPSSVVKSRSAVSTASTKNLPARNMGVHSIGHASQTSSSVNSASISSSLTNQSENNHLLSNFNGLSDLDNAALNPFTVEPPDQGLCVGYLTDTSNGQQIPMEFEVVNDVIAIYLPNGSLVAETSLGTFFGDVNFPTSNTLVVGDPRCHFDSQTHTFFFTVTVIGTSPYLPNSQSRVDLAVINANTQVGAEYLIDTTDTGNSNCPCYADSPNLGLDDNAVYITSNEFTLPVTNSHFQEAQLFVLSKSQLVHQAKSVAYFPGTFPSIGYSVQPAINLSSANSEYLENALPSSSGSNTLVLWHVTNDQHIANGVAPVLNPPQAVTVETYRTPVPAASTGTGAVTNGYTSATTLDAGDGRIQQVEGIQDEGHIELWSSLDTEVSIKGDSHVRDGIAWYRINPARAKVVEQGIIASPGNYLLYPAILHSYNGTTAIVFSITSTKLNPSAAYVLSQSSPTNFGSTLHIAALGANPYLTAFNRWGDYSAAALDLNGNDIWLATEYIPVQRSTTYFINWGTEVFEVTNNQ